MKQPLAIRIAATLFSYVFHPLFIPLYVTWFLAFVHPRYFEGFSLPEKEIVLIRIAYIMIFFPVVTIFLLKKLKFIDSFYLRTQKDRIIPYIACGIYFFWMFIVLRNSETSPLILTQFIFAVFLSSSAALIANIYNKISMHAIGMGGLVGVFLVVAQSNTMLMSWPLCIALLIAGIVCTSRLLVSDHTAKEIYLGLFLGFICQIIAAVTIV